MRTQIEDVRDEAHIGWFQEQPSLRDRFAMAALTGLLAGRQPHGVMTKKDWAEAAYKQADAMMETRK